MFCIIGLLWTLNNVHDRYLTGVWGVSASCTHAVNVAPDHTPEHLKSGPFVCNIKIIPKILMCEPGFTCRHINVQLLPDTFRNIRAPYGLTCYIKQHSMTKKPKPLLEILGQNWMENIKNKVVLAETWRKNCCTFKTSLLHLAELLQSCSEGLETPRKSWEMDCLWCDFF